MRAAFTRFMIAIACTAGASAARAQGNLPIQVQADMQIARIEAAVAAGKAAEALDGVLKYRRLGLKMPPAIIFLEANLSSITKDYVRSKLALDEYLVLTDIRMDKNYTAALALYSKVEPAYNIIRQRALDDCANADEPTRLRGASFRECNIAPEMVVIPSGTFKMGSSSDERERHDNERPNHRVTLPLFAVSKFEVTFDEWDTCVAMGGCNGHRATDRWGRGLQPVVGVNWEDARSYVTWLSEFTGKPYRLLSEAEWEYSARSGSTTAFAFGATITGRQAVFSGAPSGTPQSALQRSRSPGLAGLPDSASASTSANSRSSGGARPVGSLVPNSFGLHDVHGNVAEWTQDCWNGDYKDAPNDGSAWTGGDCSQRVVRGGSWRDDAQGLRVSARKPASSGVREDFIGFRVAMTLD